MGKFNFKKLEEYFTIKISPKELCAVLASLKDEYLKMCLKLMLLNENPEYIADFSVSENSENLIYNLEELQRVLNEMEASDEND
jgi:NADH:ubiquinone oxidoreductase subunit C